jgi:hypothetical protein
MNSPFVYVPSELFSGEVEVLRNQNFTRWMSKDLTQAATDFCRNIGFYALYCECSPEQLTRYIFWRPPPGAMMEVRSGRPKEKFEIFDRANQDRKWPLLTLQIIEGDLYSAVWISADYYDAAVKALSYYGINPAQRKRVV